MTVSLKHTFQSAKSDSSDVTIVQPSNWNEEHELTLATNKVLGRATAGTGAAEELSIGTALSVSGGTLAVTTVPAANGGTGITSPGTSGNVLTSNGTGWTSSALPVSAVAYPQNIQSADYTLVLSDAGKQIFHPASDANVRTFTIPANSSVAFPIGTVVLFTVENLGTQVNVAITSDTLINGSGVTGTQVVLPNNTLMCIKVTATKWMANYLSPQDLKNNYQIAVAATGGLAVYPWNSGIGFGAKYTDPATLPTGGSSGVAFSPDGITLAVSHTSTPYVSVYPWSRSGFGVKYANPATLPTGSGNGVDFAPNGDAIAVAHTTTPFISVYPWNSSTGFGTKFANPATLPTGTGQEVAFSPLGTSIAVVHDTSPLVTAYPWDIATGFGTKYANPATLPTGSSGRGVAFNPAGDTIAVAHENTPYISVYPWNSSTGFGVKYANPATLPAGFGLSVAFSPAGNTIAVGYIGGSSVNAYPWSGAGFGTKYANPATVPTGFGFGVAFSPAGDAIAVAHTTSPIVSAYPWSTAGFGTKYADPATLPGADGNSVAFNTSF
jgi:hypothetical protein